MEAGGNRLSCGRPGYFGIQAAIILEMRVERREDGFHMFHPDSRWVKRDLQWKDDWIPVVSLTEENPKGEQS
jgi:hypothetical protein